MATVRSQIRDAVVAALTGLATSQSRVFKNRTLELQDGDLPGLRIYTNEEDTATASLGISRIRETTMVLRVEACSKKSSGMDDELETMIGEVLTAIDANQGAGGAKYIEPRRLEIEMEGAAEKEVGVAKMSYEVFYITAQGRPDVAL